MILFCPHCEEIEEILGEPRRLECNTCGAVLELVCDLAPAKAFNAAFETVFGRVERARPPIGQGGTVPGSPPYDHLVGRSRKRARLRHEARIAASGQEG